MNTLHSSLQDYLELRRGLGFKMHDAGRLLPRFVTFLQARQEPHITARSALEWAQQADVQPAEWARRLGFVRGFARYCSAIDSQTEVPPVQLLPHRSTRARPYLYSDEEVRRLLAAALRMPTDRSSSALRPWTFHCLLGLLSVTGLRISEALDLQVNHVNIQQATLTIQAPKLGRSRLVPLHPTTVAVLLEYMRRRDEFLGSRGSPYLFISTRGTRLDVGRVHRTFYDLSRRTGLRAPGASQGPRLHDFRHRFAVTVLTQWYQAGIDPQRHMPVLSTFLGHVYVQGTYWYLSGAPELMTLAMARLERRWGDAS
jgi:integrase/recombinase XerD